MHACTNTWNKQDDHQGGSGNVNRLLRYAGQVVMYAAFAVILGYFSTAPSYTHIPADRAVIKLTLSHAGARIGECHKLTGEELARLAPNMRVETQCPRERSPVTLELQMDGERLYYAVLQPGGLHRDSNANTYQRFTVPAGEHNLLVRLNDSVHVQGYNHVRQKRVTLEPGRVLVIDFKPDSDGFVFH
jgi:hypothetical protein